ncbi:MAG TPA: hypothetical protein VFT04_08545 [Gemmatimonadales bacterium]|nr:hypothetical protein [Gemmatimonadales bacterium]
MSGIVVGTAALLASAWMVRLEVRRRDRRHLALRIGASVIALGALTALALEPALPRHIVNERVVLAAGGISRAGAQRIADSAAARQVLVLGESVADLSALRRTHPSVAEVVVAGWGLPADELARAGDLRVSLAPVPLPPGIRSLSWPSRVVLGESVAITGKAIPASWIHLGGTGVTSDSARADTDGGFELRFTPRAAGLQSFTLANGGVTDTGAVDVRARTPPAVLLVEGTPGFELTHLRRWLARRGGKVAARTSVSRGRSRTFAVKGASAPGRALTAELLRDFDIVILDDAAARAMSGSELAALRDAVTREGLGVLVTGAGLRPGGLPLPATRPGRATRTIRVRAVGSRKLSPPVTAESWTPMPDAAGTVLLEEGDGDAVVAWEAAGAGRVGISAVRNPSRWLLEGDRDAYDRYWTAILASLARPAARWRLPSELPAETGRPFSLTWPSRLDTLLVSGPDGIDTLFPTPDRDSLTWTATLWPRSTGEYRAYGPGDTLRFRAAARGGWLAARAAANQRATELHAALHDQQASGADSVAAAPVAPWIFLAIFTAASGWLWWERRGRTAG